MMHFHVCFVSAFLFECIRLLEGTLARRVYVYPYLLSYFLLQVKRKYSYSAVGSTVQEEVDAANMGIMAKLKKLQKERLIVARLGFPDKAIEIDQHIEKIRADLRVGSFFFCYLGMGLTEQWTTRRASVYDAFYMSSIA